MAAGRPGRGAAGRTRDVRGQRGVVLVGPAGVGKTRLALELARGLEDEGYATVWLVASRSAASIPLGAFAPLVPPVASVDVVSVNAVAEHVKERFTAGRLALFVDDAHLLDDASAALLHRLVLDGTALAVVTVRSGPAPDAVLSLWKNADCERFEVQALSFEEVEHLVGAVLGGPVDEAVPQKLWRASRGNPLFLRELVGAVLDDGTLAARRGTWIWTGRVRLAPALADLVRARLAGLDRDALDALALLALAEPIALEVLVALRGNDAVELLARAADRGGAGCRHGAGRAPAVRRDGPWRCRRARRDAVESRARVGAPGSLHRARGGAAAGRLASRRRCRRRRRAPPRREPLRPGAPARARARASRARRSTREAASRRISGSPTSSRTAAGSRRRTTCLPRSTTRGSTTGPVSGSRRYARRHCCGSFRVRAMRCAVIEEAEEALSDPSLASELMATRLQAALQEGLADEVRRLAAVGARRRAGELRGEGGRDDCRGSVVVAGGRPPDCDRALRNGARDRRGLGECVSRA